MRPEIGFRRDVYLDWLDTTAAFSVETADISTLRVRLEPIVAERIEYPQNRRQVIDILLNIWVKTGATHHVLRDEAVAIFARAEVMEDRVWLHYGLTLLRYSFFRLALVVIGQVGRSSDTVTTAEVKKRLYAEIGQLGTIPRATSAVISSLRNWGILMNAERRSAYRPLRQSLSTRDPAVEAWLLEVALAAHPAEELPFADLLRLPELFPFRFTLTIDDLRRLPRFEVHRQGLGWDMVRLAPASLAPTSDAGAKQLPFE